jgi:putative transposase
LHDYEYHDKPQMTSHHRKRCKRYEVPGDAHFLTFSCHERRPLLSRDRSRQWMLDSLALGRNQSLCDLWAFVIMPEHVHLVLWPRNNVANSRILKTLKQSVSHRARLWLASHAPSHLAPEESGETGSARSFHFWQRGGGYDRNLRRDVDVHEKIAYCHNNPIQRGLVSRACDWPWSSARAWETGLDEPIAIDRATVPRLLVTEK